MSFCLRASANAIKEGKPNSSEGRYKRSIESRYHNDEDQATRSGTLVQRERKEEGKEGSKERKKGRWQRNAAQKTVTASLIDG